MLLLLRNSSFAKHWWPLPNVYINAVKVVPAGAAEVATEAPGKLLQLEQIILELVGNPLGLWKIWVRPHLEGENPKAYTDGVSSSEIMVTHCQ